MSEENSGKQSKTEWTNDQFTKIFSKEFEQDLEYLHSQDTNLSEKDIKLLKASIEFSFAALNSEAKEVRNTAAQKCKNGVRCKTGPVVSRANELRANKAKNVTAVETLPVKLLPSQIIKPPSHIPLIALVGRPNVGKSSIFNVLAKARSAVGKVGRRKIARQSAIVSAIPGTTRDRSYAECHLGNKSFRVVDTGGITSKHSGGELDQAVSREALIAIEEADIIALITDVTEGIQDYDKFLARHLKKTIKPLDRVALIVNKVDNYQREEEAENFVRLGLGRPLLVTAAHNAGLQDAVEVMLQKYQKWVDSVNKVTAADAESANISGTPSQEGTVNSRANKAPKKNTIQEGKEDETEMEEFDDVSLLKEVEVIENELGDQSKYNSKDLRISIVGRPNVGKSSILNRVCGIDRAIVSDIAGTTHDPVDQRILWREDTEITLIDTAGIRKKAFQQTGVESLSVMWALNAIDRSEVAILVLDATQGVLGQDKKIASHILERHAGVVVVVNKWEGKRAKKSSQTLYIKHVRGELQFLKYVPIVFASALTGDNIIDVMDLAVSIGKDRRTVFPTRKLMKWFHASNLHHKSPRDGKRRLKIKFAAQAKISVPTFVLFVNHLDMVTDNYKKYLEGVIRKHHPFVGIPVRLVFRQSQNTRPAKKSPSKKSLRKLTRGNEEGGE